MLYLNLKVENQNQRSQQQSNESFSKTRKLRKFSRKYYYLIHRLYIDIECWFHRKRSDWD